MDATEYERRRELTIKFERYDWSGFWRGYRRGLARKFLGEGHGTEAEHREWMEKAEAFNNPSEHNHGLGYRAGYAEKDPQRLFDARKGMIKR